MKKKFKDILSSAWKVIRVPVVLITRLRILFINESLLMIYKISKKVFSRILLEKVVKNVLKFFGLWMAFFVSNSFLFLCFLLCIIQPIWAKVDPIGYLDFIRVDNLLRFWHIILFSFVCRLMARNFILSFDPEFSDYRYLDVYIRYDCEVYCYLFIVVLIGTSSTEAQLWQKTLKEFEPSITLCEVYERVNIFFNLAYQNPLKNKKKRW